MSQLMIRNSKGWAALQFEQAPDLVIMFPQPDAEGALLTEVVDRGNRWVLGFGKAYFSVSKKKSETLNAVLEAKVARAAAAEAAAFAKMTRKQQVNYRQVQARKAIEDRLQAAKKAASKRAA